MSLDFPADHPAADRRPVSITDLRDYFHAGAKPPAAWRVGAEFEKFALDRQTGRALSYHEPGGVRDVLAALAGRFGWAGHEEDGHLTALARDGATVSLEPGGQVEFSTAPVLHLGELAAEVRRHREELRAVTDPDRVVWAAVGVTPFARVEDIAPGVRRRHAVMAEYLPARGPMAHHMMRATASTQVAFDYADEADAVRKFAAALTLGPVVNAVWGNSPLAGGAATGWASYRGRVWLGMDPDRCGTLPHLLADGLSFDRWAAYLLDVPMLFTVAGGAYRPAGGRTFRDFLDRGIDGRFPTMTDWELHLTTVFPEVRLKHFLEVRGADAAPLPLALAVPAVWKGLLYDADALSAATAVAAHFPPDQLPGLFERAARHGLAADHAGRPLREWARDLAHIAADGLRRQAERGGYADERPYLDPVFEILAAGRSPGMALAERCTSSPFTPADVWSAVEY